MSDQLRSRLSVFVTLLLLGFITVSLATAEPPEQDRAKEIGSLVRCPVCNGESIAESPAPLAQDMMSVVREGIGQGLSDEQIIDGLLFSYTDSQRLDPEVSPATIALWLLPGGALLIGMVLIAGEMRRRPRATESARRRVEAAERS
jgi:cytochrome c-type biogenesis protein CcmH